MVPPLGGYLNVPQGTKTEEIEMTQVPQLPDNADLEIPLQFIHAKKQARIELDKDEVKRLADSIAEVGVLEPVVVVPVEGGYNIEYGHKRVAAAKLVGLKTVPCVLGRGKVTDEGSDLDTLLGQISENNIREDLSPLDLAFSCKRMVDEFKIKVKDIPALLKSYGMTELSRSRISNIMRLLELPKWAQTMLKKKQLTVKQALMILPGKDFSKVTSEIKKEVEDHINNPNYYDDFNSDEMAMIVSNAFDNAGYVEIPKHRMEQLSAEEKKQIEIVNCPEPWNSDTTSPRAINPKVYEKIFEEKEKAKTNNSNNNKPSNKTTTKTENKRPAISEKGLNDYLQQWLINWLQHKLTMAPEQFITNVGLNIVYWLAFQAPCKFGRNAPEYMDIYEALEGMGIKDINDFLNDDFDEKQTGYNQILCNLTVKNFTLDNAIFLSKRICLDIEKNFTIDEDFLKLYTKPGLVDLGKRFFKDNETWQKAIKGKLDAIKQFLIDNKETVGCPKEVTELYNNFDKE